MTEAVKLCCATCGQMNRVPVARLAEGPKCGSCGDVLMDGRVADWTRSYPREHGCFPPGAFRVAKYWPPVGRVDNVFGDRNLVCTCPPVESYIQAAE